MGNYYMQIFLKILFKTNPTYIDSDITEHCYATRTMTTSLMLRSDTANRCFKLELLLYHKIKDQKYKFLINVTGII